eukprot:1720846-Amphidinium_carterae.1
MRLTTSCTCDNQDNSMKKTLNSDCREIDFGQMKILILSCNFNQGKENVFVYFIQEEQAQKDLDCSRNWWDNSSWLSSHNRRFESTKCNHQISSKMSATRNYTLYAYESRSHTIRSATYILEESSKTF